MCTYSCRPGTIKKHITHYERLGKGPPIRHLGEPFAYLVTETGNANDGPRLNQEPKTKEPT